MLKIKFRGAIWYWRGPAPWYFVTVPEPECRELKAIAGSVTYGWGMIPVTVCIGKTKWDTSLWPKDGSYIVPVKARARAAENLLEGEEVVIRLEIG